MSSDVLKRKETVVKVALITYSWDFLILYFMIVLHFSKFPDFQISQHNTIQISNLLNVKKFSYSLDVYQNWPDMKISTLLPFVVSLKSFSWCICQKDNVAVNFFIRPMSHRHTANKIILQLQ